MRNRQYPLVFGERAQSREERPTSAKTILAVVAAVLFLLTGVYTVVVDVRVAPGALAVALAAGYAVGWALAVLEARLRRGRPVRAMPAWPALASAAVGAVGWTLIPPEALGESTLALWAFSGYMVAVAHAARRGVFPTADDL